MPRSLSYVDYARFFEVMRSSFRSRLVMLTIVPLVLAQFVILFAVMRTVERDVAERAH